MPLLSILGAYFCRLGALNTWCYQGILDVLYTGGSNDDKKKTSLSSLSFVLKALNTKVKTKLKVRNFLKLHKDYILRLTAGKKSYYKKVSD